MSASILARAGLCALATTLVALLLDPAAAHAADRRRVEERSTAPARVFVPGAAASAVLYAPLLSGLDFTAVAPLGSRLRVIEDEPYIYLLGKTGRDGAGRASEGLCTIAIRADIADGQWYETRVSLRLCGLPWGANPLPASFDTAAQQVYMHAALASEQRGEIAYSLYEVRSPLGLTDPADKVNRAREYLAYSAAAINPQNAGEPLPETPYSYLNGELKVLRLADGRLCLLTLNFEASHFPGALTLTENIARCVINRLSPPERMRPEDRLSYLAYYPEYEPQTPALGLTLDPQVADLAERPGESCGVGAQPITGDLCPQCGGEGPFWPAAPYADGEFGATLGVRAQQARCSHCLMQSALNVAPPSVGLTIPDLRPLLDDQAQQPDKAVRCGGLKSRMHTRCCQPKCKPCCKR